MFKWGSKNLSANKQKRLRQKATQWWAVSSFGPLPSLPLSAACMFVCFGGTSRLGAVLIVQIGVVKWLGTGSGCMFSLWLFCFVAAASAFVVLADSASSGWGPFCHCWLWVGVLPLVLWLPHRPPPLFYRGQRSPGCWIGGSGGYRGNFDLFVCSSAE